MSSYKSFETERLLLISTSESDANFIVNLFNTPKWLENIGDRGVYSVEDAILYIQERMRPQLERLGFSNYTIVRKLDGAKIGICGLYDRAGLDGLDIGFALLPEFEQQGFAFEAVNRLKQAAFDEFGVTEILAITLPENVSSQKLLEKLGLKYAGIFRLTKDNEDLFLYRISSSS